MEDACDGCSPLYIMTKCARKKCISFVSIEKTSQLSLGIRLKRVNLL